MSDFQALWALHLAVKQVQILERRVVFSFICAVCTGLYVESDLSTPWYSIMYQSRLLL